MRHGDGHGDEGGQGQRGAEGGPGVGAQQLSDASLHARTGRGRDAWFAVLDAWGAAGRDHAAIARHLVEEHAVDGWWAQSITVAYEQARGMRAPGQRSDGTFSASGSATVAVPVERLFDAFADAAARERWLPGVALTVRTATAPKWFRADLGADASRIAVGFTAKGPGKARVAVQHERLADAEAAARAKDFWRDRLAALKRTLEE